MHDGMGWWMIFASTWMLIFWGVIVAGIAWAIGGINPRHGAPDSALEIARQRYARSEISQEEFQRLSEDLKG
jgi:putative membrane protein